MSPKKRKQSDDRAEPDLARYANLPYSGLSLYVPRVRTSWVWEYMRWVKKSLPASDGGGTTFEIVCLLCTKALWRQAYHNTSNAERHLESIHKKTSPADAAAAAKP